MEEASGRAIGGQHCQADGGSRSLNRADEAGGIEVGDHISRMGGIYLDRRFLEGMGQMDGEGIDCGFAGIIGQRFEVFEAGTRCGMKGE